MNYTSEIIEDWFSMLRDNHVGVQPKATTLLKNVLDRYEIQPKDKDVWNEFMSVKAGEFDVWYNGLMRKLFVNSQNDKSWLAWIINNGTEIYYNMFFNHFKNFVF